MKTLVANFSKQLTQAVEIGKKAVFTQPSSPIHNVLISGLGGSGIGGSIVSELVAGETKAPISVTKGYFIPSYVGKNTLFIASSYSGNTEETIQCLEQAMKAGAKIVCITSGGKIAEIAQQNNYDHILIPGGMPPRSCLGYSLTQLFFVLGGFGTIGESFKQQLNASITLLDAEEENIKVEAKKVADEISTKMPVIYSTTYNEGISIRFRQQVNENAKMLCWHHVIPEMNHNELVGWREHNEKLAVILFRDHDEYERNDARIEINKEVIKQYTHHIIEIYSKGKSKIEKAIYLIHLGDWISVYMAENRGVDAVEVNVINHLKSALAKI